MEQKAPAQPEQTQLSTVKVMVGRKAGAPHPLLEIPSKEISDFRVKLASDAGNAQLLQDWKDNKKDPGELLILAALSSCSGRKSIFISQQAELEKQINCYKSAAQSARSDVESHEKYIRSR